jgi:methylmalonyl-CoA mutase
MADNCNSLHTNAYDEAITTPTPESVRRAVAIQLINALEFGLLKNENPLQGSHIVEWLTNVVEEAVLEEFERLSERGDVLGAMESMYQRSKIQEESLHYERLKHTGEYPIVGVNTFIAEDAEEGGEIPLTRSTPEEKNARLEHLRDFHSRHASVSADALARLQNVARSGGNIFEELLDTVRACSLGQISNALYEVGGQYRRNM